MLALRLLRYKRSFDELEIPFKVIVAFNTVTPLEFRVLFLVRLYLGY